MRHTKKQENITHSKENIHPLKTEIVPEKDLMVNLLEKDFKTNVLNKLKELKQNVEKFMYGNGNIKK